MRFDSKTLLAALVASLAVTGCGSDDSDDKEPPRPITLMTFNVLCSLCNLEEYDPWDERLAYFEDIFARHDPDLIGIQELTPLNGEVDELLATAPGRGAVFYGPEDRPPYPDATILYRTSRFEVLERGEYWLSPTPEVPSSSGFASPQLPRLVVWARLRDRAGDRELYFATTHFDNNSPSQELSAPLVLDRTAPWAKTHPVIVNGDFNSRPDSAAYATLTTDTSHGFVFTNAFDLAAEWHVVTNQSPEPAYDLNDRIDHNFLAGDGVTWTVSSWIAELTVYGDQQRYPSDHFPIVSVVEY